MAKVVDAEEEQAPFLKFLQQGSLTLGIYKFCLIKKNCENKFSNN